VSDEFRRLLEVATAQAIPFGAIAPDGQPSNPEIEDAENWAERAADSLRITASGELRAARVRSQFDLKTISVQFSQGVPERAHLGLVLNLLRGFQDCDDPAARVREAIRTARVQLARACIAVALRYVGHASSLRARGFEREADRMLASAPEALRTGDWSDADALCAEPRQFVGWFDGDAADVLGNRLSDKNCDKGGFSEQELLRAMALSWACEAAAQNDPTLSADLFAECALALAQAEFIAGWDEGEKDAMANARDEIAKAARSESARRAAIASHRENHAERAYVETYFAEHRAAFRSMDAAAQAIAGTHVTATYRTVRRWIGEWSKRHSARTA